jgi:hypothetical protein
VAIVNQEFARRYWLGADPLGKPLRLNHLSILRCSRLTMPVSPFTRASPEVLYHMPLRSRTPFIDADLPLFDLTILDSRIQLNTTDERIGGVFVGAFGILALVLAAVGVCGVRS